MVRPRLLDAFGGAQGSGVGYARAGWAVTSVDREPHDRHPEIEAVVVADALDVLSDRGYLSSFDAVHAGPPCQAHTNMSNKHRGKGTRADEHVDLVPPTREALIAWGGPYVIENVPGAPLRAPVILTGGMFGLGVHRPRLFESNLPLVALPDRGVINPIGVYGRDPDGRRLYDRADGTIQRAASSLEEGQRAMGIDWMAWHDLTEAVPPAYTRWIGLQLLDLIAVGAA